MVAVRRAVASLLSPLRTPRLVGKGETLATLHEPPRGVAPSNEPLVVRATRRGSSVIATAEDHHIELSVATGHREASAAGDFAAFLFLPIAMRTGRPLHIAGRGDPAAARNAAALSQVWEMWLPRLFRGVAVTFDSYAETPPGRGTLVLYSGGVDSTYNLLMRKQAGAAQSLLTIQGLDYRATDDARFAALIEKTRPFADYVADERILVNTDAYSAYSGIDVDTAVGHGFVLGAGLLLFNDQFAGGEIAADYSRAQEFLVHPWGTNHLTNGLFASGSFALNTADGDKTRTEKVAEIARSPLALSTLSFCVDYRRRPGNCGVCSKCTRTKAMFLAATGVEPEIFDARGIRADRLLRWNFSKASERAFFVDLYQTAMRTGNDSLLPGLYAAADLFRGATSA